MNSVPTFNAPVSRLKQPPRIYYVHPLQLRGYDAWAEVFEHAHSLGFDTVLTAPLFERGNHTSVFVSRTFDRIDPVLQLGDDIEGTFSQLAALAANHQVRLMVDLVIDRNAREDGEDDNIVADPRTPPDANCSQVLDLSASQSTYRYLEEWRQRVGALVDAGVAGFRCLGIGHVPEEAWATLI